MKRAVIALAFSLVGCAARAQMVLTPCDVEAATGVVKCARYRVWEDRASRNGRQIELNVIVLRAGETPREHDPLVILAGGPGQAPSSLVRFVGTTFAEVRRHRDIVLVDLRGTGRSHSLACPELAQPSAGGVFDADWLPPDAVSRCRRRLEANADLRLYTTEIAMADLDEVLAALGYERINLYGTSYGTRAAQIYMRDFPEHVRTVTLKAVVPQSMNMPATHAPDAEQAWKDLVERCNADLPCRAAYPTLDADFRSVITRLERSPVTIDANVDGRTTKLTLTRGLFGETFRNFLYSPDLAARAPAIVRTLSRGDYSSIAQMALQTRTLAGNAISAGFFLSVSCTEDVPFIDMKAAEEAARSTFGGDYRLQQQRRACGLWPHGKLSRPRGEPVRSDAPVLLFSGDRDPVTPPARAAEVASHFPNGRHVVVANNGHAFGSLGDCGQRLIAEFIRTESAANLDVSCASGIPAVPFLIEP